MGVWYTTRERVKRALDIAETARNDAQVDDAIDAASRTVEGQLHRRFYPETRTQTFDWPNHQYARTWRLWLNQHELISVTTLTVAGETVSSDDYFTRPDDGPPYTHIEIDLDSSAAFSAGDTHQRAISIAGVFGHSADEESAGTLAEALDVSETGIDVSNSAAIGVGDIIKVDSERMIVTGRSMASTGQTVQTTALTAQANNVTVQVSDGTGFTVGEVILIDSERMLVVDIAGNALTVKRSWDGTVLAAHNTGVTIYAPRTLTVTRGALGTTAATHSTSTAVTRHVVPGLVRSLCAAEALHVLLQETSGYARPSGARSTGGGARTHQDAYGLGLDALREQAYEMYGRKARKGAV